MVTLLATGGALGNHRCDARCHNAETSRCHCCCHGLYHGKREGSPELRAAVDAHQEELLYLWGFREQRGEAVIRFARPNLDEPPFIVNGGGVRTHQLSLWGGPKIVAPQPRMRHKGSQGQPEGL